MAGLRRILSIVLPTTLPSAVYNSIMCWAEGALTPSLVLFLSACARFYENLRTIRAAFWPPWPLAYSIKSVIEDSLSALSQCSHSVPGSIEFKLLGATHEARYYRIRYTTTRRDQAVLLVNISLLST